MKTGYDLHFKKIKKNNTRFKVKPTVGSSNEIPGIKIQKKKKKQKFPIMSVMISICILAGASYGYMHPEVIDQYLGKIEIGFLGHADAQTAAPQKQKIPSPSKKEENLASGNSLETKSKMSSVTGLTAEEIALFNSLEERKKQLDAKEAELKKLEEELHNQKIELEKRLASLEQLRTQIGNQLQERVNTDAEQVDKLVAFYSSMKPQTAAKVIEKINEDLAVEVLRKMKKKEAAEIMNMIESEKAQRLSEKFAGYKK